MSRARPDRGFSLIEALVALAVFASVGVGLVAMQTQSVRAQSQTEARAFATIVAQNILAEAAAANAPPALGARDGRTDMVGQTWPWRVQVEETLDAGTRRMRVIVRDPQTQAIAADMTAFIALRAGA